VIGIQPSEWRGLTPAELFESQESWTESQGGLSRRQRRRAAANLAHLKQLYPDTPCAGTA